MQALPESNPWKPHKKPSVVICPQVEKEVRRTREAHRPASLKQQHSSSSRDSSSNKIGESQLSHIQVLWHSPPPKARVVIEALF